MKSEVFEFPFSHRYAKYTVHVERFKEDKRIHLWTYVKDTKGHSLIKTYYEISNDAKLFWYRSNADKDDLFSRLEKTLSEKLRAMKESKELKTYIIPKKFVLY